jgi:hypothetical protein
MRTYSKPGPLEVGTIRISIMASEGEWKLLLLDVAPSSYYAKETIGGLRDTIKIGYLGTFSRGASE